MLKRSSLMRCNSLVSESDVVRANIVSSFSSIDSSRASRSSVAVVIKSRQLSRRSAVMEDLRLIDRRGVRPDQDS